MHYECFNKLTYEKCLSKTRGAVFRTTASYSEGLRFEFRPMTAYPQSFRHL